MGKDDKPAGGRYNDPADKMDEAFRAMAQNLTNTSLSTGLAFGADPGTLVLAMIFAATHIAQAYNTEKDAKIAMEFYLKAMQDGVAVAAGRPEGSEVN